MVPEKGMNRMLPRVRIDHVQASDGAELVAANLASIALHEPWVSPCRDQASFLGYLSRCDNDRAMGFIAREQESGRIVGVINLTGIIHGFFQNAYMGYYGVAGMNGRGLMREAIGLVMRHAFNDIGLHRLEANIQPGNEASKALAKRLGFRLEGYSPSYLKIDGEWRDHERWAILSEEWRG
jgi:[ribosomal protein S5]-alanine N-acetyltransferase